MSRFLVLLGGNLLEPTVERLWFMAALASLGSTLAQIGFVVGGSAVKRDEPSQIGQFTLKQLLVFFIPVAIYFGYLSGHFSK